jgi:hypothetical protein
LVLHHSNGETFEARVELIIRDSLAGSDEGGDVLICQIDAKGRWLLFPPVQTKFISARNGDKYGEIVVMVRGDIQSLEGHWHEVFSLTTDDEQAGFEWLEMLGLVPVPPALPTPLQRTQSLLKRLRADEEKKMFINPSVIGTIGSPAKTRSPSPREIDVPIGERSVVGRTLVETRRPTSANLASRGEDQRRREEEISLARSSPAAPTADDTDEPTTPRSKHHSRCDSESDFEQLMPTSLNARSLNEAMELAGGLSGSGLRRAKANRRSRHISESPTMPTSSRRARHVSEEPVSSIGRAPSRSYESDNECHGKPNKKLKDSDATIERTPSRSRTTEETTRKHASRRTSDGEEIHNDRTPTRVVGEPKKHAQTRTPQFDASPKVHEVSPAKASHANDKPPVPEHSTSKAAEKSSVLRQMEQFYNDQHDPIKSPQSDRKPKAEVAASHLRYHRRISSVPTLDQTMVSKARKSTPPPPQGQEPLPKASAHKPKSPTTPIEQHRRASDNLVDDVPPPPPPHKTPSPVQMKGSVTPVLNPSSGYTPVKRRSSSPLKHEYQPSDISDTSTQSEDSSSGDSDSAVSISDIEESEFEDDDKVTPLVEISASDRQPKVSPPASTYAPQSRTLAPSDSASQAPYASVPSQPAKALKAIATIHSWSDEQGRWEQLYSDECSIVITPGLIQAFEMSAVFSRPPTSSSPASEPTRLSTVPESAELEERPLVSYELTPLVPLRKGTAIDITIRSPPMAVSRLAAGNNVLFRSRNLDECEQLYQAIHWSRLNNPRYIHLQNARRTIAGSDCPSAPAWRTGRKFWSFGRKNSYRAASSIRARSIATSESSVPSLSSTFLRKLGSGSKLFNISKSTITSRRSGASGGSDSVWSSAASSITSPGPSSTPIGGQMGMATFAIRLYKGFQSTSWKSLGPGRLIISNPPPDSRQQVLPNTGVQKRIVVISKTAWKHYGMDAIDNRIGVLVDVVLGAINVGMVARTGLLMNVWEEMRGDDGEVGTVGKAGGVSGRNQRWMLHCKNEAQTKYIYQMVVRQF